MHYDSRLHVQGCSEFVDDTTPPSGMLHAAVYGSPIAHGHIQSINTDAASEIKGVEAIILFDDIPGEGYIGALVHDEPLLAKGEVKYHGQPIALVVAQDAAVAREAAMLIEPIIVPLPVVTCPKKSYDEGLLLQPIRVFEKGDPDSEWPHCEHVIEGSVDIGGQEHLYLETNRARAVPLEDGKFKVYSSTQSPSSVQKSVSGILGIPMHQVEVDVRRIGGGFGGKEDQATHWACMAALAARILCKPVQIVLNREEDMRMTGKRHPFKQDYKMGLDKDYQIQAYQIEHYQNAGAYTDLSPAVLERSILHSTNAYSIPNVRIQGAVCGTNLPPNTAYRGFGAPQAMFALEAAIHRAAQVIGVDADLIQERNLIKGRYTFHYGQTIEDSGSIKSWNELKAIFRLSDVKERIANFNATHKGAKKGYALMPVCFGISFTRTFLNQGNALLHVYTDGSVNLNSGGVEMGQGISSNLVEIAAKTLGIRSERIKCNSVNTSRIANISPSAASSTTDLNGGATIVACQKILAGLKKVASKKFGVAPEDIELRNEKVFVKAAPTEMSWSELVLAAYQSRESLMAHGFYATPGIDFNNHAGKGIPFHYYACGTCLIEATVDCLRGTYSIDSAKIVHDLGRPVIKDVDLGQIEGGLAQGIGWTTLEELLYDEKGVLVTNSLSRYKVPDNDFLPNEIDVRFLEDSERAKGPVGSKAVGEPPFMYGIAAYFAINHALSAFKRQQYGDEWQGKESASLPMNPEKVLLSMYPSGESIIRES